MLIYPLDTIKTRMISRNPLADVARFDYNRAGELTTYLGIVRGYGSILIGNLCHLTIGRENLILAATIEGVLKTWIDMSKISKQMGNPKGDLDIMKKSFLPCSVFGVLRDITYRKSYLEISSYFHKKYMANSRFYDERKRMNNLFFASILATIISQPFDVLFVKTASQRMIKYMNILEIPKQIVSEEGASKLLVGGLWPRLVYNIISTTILANTYESTLSAVVEAF